MTVLIEKSGSKKKITKLAWDLMGENKNGWSIVEEKNQNVSNQIEKPNKPVDKTPPSAQFTKIADNKSVKNEVDPKKNQNVSNEAGSTGSEQEVDEEEDNASETTLEASKEFIDVALTIKRNMVKDYLDMKEIPFKQNATDLKLIGLVANHLKNDVELLKTEFGL